MTYGSHRYYRQVLSSPGDKAKFLAVEPMIDTAVLTVQGMLVSDTVMEFEVEARAETGMLVCAAVLGLGIGEEKLEYVVKVAD